MMDGIYTTNLSADKQKFVHDHHTSAQKTYDLAGVFAPTIVVVQDNIAYPYMGFRMEPEGVEEAVFLIRESEGLEEPSLVVLSAAMDYYEIEEEGVTGPITAICTYAIDSDYVTAVYCTRKIADSNWEEYDIEGLDDNDTYLDIISEYLDSDPD